MLQGRRCPFNQKDEKGTKGGVSFSAAGSNWGDGTSGPPMFILAQGSPPPLSWMMLWPNGTSFPLVSVNPYQARYNYKNKGSFDSEISMRYVQPYVIAVQHNIYPAPRSMLIIYGFNTHLVHEKIQHARYIFIVFYIQVTYIPTTNANGPFSCFVIFFKSVLIHALSPMHLQELWS